MRVDRVELVVTEGRTRFPPSEVNKELQQAYTKATMVPWVRDPVVAVATACASGLGRKMQK
jgi:hypothetical protein